VRIYALLSDGGREGEKERVCVCERQRERKLSRIDVGFIATEKHSKILSWI